jgi:hypothetical protein
MRCPSCGSGPDLVLIRLSPSEDARIGDSAAADAPPPPASLSGATDPFLPSPAGLEEADEEALLGAAAAEPKSLSRFLGVSDLVFFLSDLEEDEDAGDATEPEAGAEVGVRGLLLPSGLDEDSEDLCRDEKKRPLNTIASVRPSPPRPPGRSFVEQVVEAKRSERQRDGLVETRERGESVRAGTPQGKCWDQWGGLRVVFLPPA